MKQNAPPLVLRSEMRTDSVPVDEHYSTEGYFYDNPILTRTGIFKYTLEDGSERRELRRPEDVFDPESLASYEGKPIIITHDARVIDKDNARRERVGTILTPGKGIRPAGTVCWVLSGSYHGTRRMERRAV